MGCSRRYNLAFWGIYIHLFVVDTALVGSCRLLTYGLSALYTYYCYFAYHTAAQMTLYRLVQTFMH
jgi:hypothetical protein